jgi:hypothetical protein
MATPSTMVINSLIMLGAKEIGGTLTAAEQTHYLAKLNSMLESWSLERLMCYQVVEESKALTASDGTYTIGSGGDWDTARPTKIVQAWIRDSDNEDTPLKVINADSYNSIPAKTTDGTYPEYLYYDGAFVAGLASIYLYPEPSASLTLYISSWKQLQSFATISTTLVLPPGYQRAIEYNFAIEEAGGLRDVPASVIKIARESKAAIKNVNLP